MVEVIQIWQDLTHHLERQISRREATFPAFFFATASHLGKSSLLNMVCQMGQCKRMWSRCKCFCLCRWGRPEMQAQQLAQEISDPLIPGPIPKGSRKSGKGRHRAEHLRHFYFLQLKLPLFHSSVHSLFSKYFLSLYYTRHLKGEKFLKKGIQNIKERMTLLSLSENSHAYCENRYKNKLL